MLSVDTWWVTDVSLSAVCWTARNTTAASGWGIFWLCTCPDALTRRCENWMLRMAMLRPTRSANQVAAPQGQINGVVLSLLITSQVVVDDDVVPRDTVCRQFPSYCVDAVGDGHLAPPRHKNDLDVDRQVAGHLLSFHMEHHRLGLAFGQNDGGCWLPEMEQRAGRQQGILGPVRTDQVLHLSDGRTIPQYGIHLASSAP